MEGEGKDSKKSKSDGLSLRIKQLVAGGCSGAITKTAVAPLERVKIILQLQGMSYSQHRHKYSGLFGTLTTLVKEEGLLSLYKGNGANVLRVVPVYALKFMFTDFFRDIFKTNPGDKTEKLSFSKLILSGTVAGLFQTSVTYPLETIRTRLTVGGAEYRGIIDVIRKTMRYEGVSGFYKGIVPTWLSGSPYTGLQMTSFEVFKRNQHRFDEVFDVHHLSKHALLVYNQTYILSCGALAGIIAQTLTYPGDTVRRRMQTNGMFGNARLYSNSWSCFVRIVREEGGGELFAGLWVNTVRAIPGAAIQFWAYEMMKSLLQV